MNDMNAVSAAPAEKKRAPKPILEEVISRENLERVFEYLRDVRYGTVTIIIQDGKVVQIDKLEKLRLK
ncbi:MAG: YezD family protein [Oscillospiraceae bacterium]|jgi:hypothetical protein|nr:YezD family protein [Oscillospiraceae bacterium]